MKTRKKLIGLLTFFFTAPAFPHGNVGDAVYLGLQFMGLILATALGCTIIGLILVKIFRISNKEQGFTLAPWMLICIFFNGYLFCTRMPEISLLDGLLIGAANLVILTLALIALWLFRLNKRKSNTEDV